MYIIYGCQGIWVYNVEFVSFLGTVDGSEVRLTT